MPVTKTTQFLSHSENKLISAMYAQKSPVLVKAAAHVAVRSSGATSRYRPDEDNVGYPQINY